MSNPIYEASLQISKLSGLKDSLTPWECGFVESLGRRVVQKNNLSEKQYETLKKVFNKYNVPDDWKAEYKEKYYEDVKILAEYYSHVEGGSFFKEIHAAKDNPDFIPNKDLVIKATTNQYAKRVLRSERGGWRYDEGEIALIRRTVNPNTIRDTTGHRVYGYFKQKIVEKPVMIIKRNDERPNQWHVYTCVFLMDPMKEVLIQERWLKDTNRKMKKKDV